MKDAITESLGQIVPFVKVRRVSDGLGTISQTHRMPARAPSTSNLTESQPKAWTPPDKELFRRALCARVKQARDPKRWTQDRMAALLGVENWQYATYERRSAMPHELLARFSEITGTSLKELLRDPR